MIVKIVVAFLIPVIISIILYFTLIEGKICDGGRKLYNCPNSDTSICVKPGINYSDMCSVNKKSTEPVRKLKVGPGNGQCVEPAKVKVEHLQKCEDCLNNDEFQQKYWNDTQNNCFDAFDPGTYSGANDGDIVAFKYGKNYSCNSPAIVTDSFPRGGVCN